MPSNRDAVGGDRPPGSADNHSRGEFSHSLMWTASGLQGPLHSFFVWLKRAVSSFPA